MTGPVTRTDYLVTDLKGVTWDEKTAAGEWNESGFTYTVPRGYRPNEKVTRNWWESTDAAGCSGGHGWTRRSGWPPARFENALRIAIPQYVNGDRSHLRLGRPR